MRPQKQRMVCLWFHPLSFPTQAMFKRRNTEGEYPKDSKLGPLLSGVEAESWITNHSGYIKRNHEFSWLKLRNHESREIVKRIMHNEMSTSIPSTFEAGDYRMCNSYFKPFWHALKSHQRTRIHEKLILPKKWKKYQEDMLIRAKL